ncbi:thioredoxin family protein [Pontibacter anaerobius]|uniref:Thioredoxin family protein n=1 Tax=Pontibacter anaerobius TaxID=2993940 RepID=A0ABT3RJH0_9BACT|nr:thioredoxin family protein [Pontibacter anaerobius]MCX2741971.1 thioredoxin family protein [Pontibacter anaerobius]
MMVLESNDNELRKLIFERDKVIVKFTDEACPICKVMQPKYKRISEEPMYQEIAFLRMNAKENPVSSREVKLKGTPFFATYNKGTLADCGIAATEEELREMLRMLLQLH